MQLTQRLNVIWRVLQLSSFVGGVLLPFVHANVKVAMVFGIFAAAGAALGWRLGLAEPRPRQAGLTARREITRAAGALGVYLVIENALPYVGKYLPGIYKTLPFWSLVVVRAAMWAVFVGLLVRLFSLLRNQ